jgi:hypothetical protein
VIKRTKLNYKKVFTFFFIIFLTLAGFSQSRETIKKQQKAERAKIDQKRNYQKARKKTIKHRQSIQTKDVQKRMKSSRKEADKYNKNFSHKKGILNRKKKRK